MTVGAPGVSGVSLVLTLFWGVCVYVLAFSLRRLCLCNPFMKGVGRRCIRRRVTKGTSGSNPLTRVAMVSNRLKAGWGSINDRTH